MIDKLNIENFMTFQKLEIPTLKRVNLIAGKNNSGKTTLLDAIRIYHSRGDNVVINNILFSRGTFRKNSNQTYDNLYNNKMLDEKMALNVNDVVLSKSVSLIGTIIIKVETNDNYDDFYLEINEGYEDPYEKLTYVPFLSNFDKLNELWDKIVLTPSEEDVHEILRETIEPDLVRFDVGQNKVRVKLLDFGQKNNRRPTVATK
jgi:predicted ATP-dependent endonuclease of OLD family